MLLALLALSGCEPVTIAVEGLGDEPPRPVAAAPQGATVPSLQSQALSAYYRRVEEGLVEQGLLRRDGGATDAPFSSRDLVENFIRIALYEEYSTTGNRIIPRQTESRLHRWEVPVAVNLQFGATVPADQQRRDRTQISSYVTRLAGVTGHPVELAEGGGNFHLFIVNEDERRALGDQIKSILPGISPAAVAAVTQMPRSTFCLVFAWDPGDSGAYAQAVAVIRAEHPNLLRLSCIHEEIAQGLGLSNDSPGARPSVFNDDEEFALLTAHDEMLLAMLYDARMAAGMTALEAREVAEIIAAELLNEAAP